MESIESLRTPRLLLRTWRDDDLAPFATLNADARVREFFPSALSRQENDALVARFRAHFLERGYGFWAVEIPGTSPFIGFIGLGDPNLPAPLSGLVEIGWRLSPEHWGQGYATEGASAALDAAFDRVGLDQVIALTVPSNVRSRRVMDKLGMVHSPHEDFDHPRVPDGHALKRHVLYRHTRERWAERIRSTGTA